MTQHKWHKEIHAWADGADGADIEYYAYNAVFVCFKPQPKDEALKWMIDNKKLESQQPTNMVWQGLAEYEIIAIDNASNDLHEFARAIEAKLKEKNT
jgi:hypothetical protein